MPSNTDVKFKWAVSIVQFYVTFSVINPSSRSEASVVSVFIQTLLRFKCRYFLATQVNQTLLYYRSLVEPH